MQIFGLVAFIEQKEYDNNDNLCKIHGGLKIYIASALIVFFLLDKGHKAENLQKECLFLLCCFRLYSWLPLPELILNYFFIVSKIMHAYNLYLT